MQVFSIFPGSVDQELLNVSIASLSHVLAQTMSIAKLA